MFDTKTRESCNATSEPAEPKGRSIAAGFDSKLAAVTSMKVGDLRAEWRRLYRAQPPRRASRDLLELGIAWKLQERAYGGLSTALKRQITALSKTMDERGDLAQSRAVKLKPGTTLVREWGGKTHDILVVEDGFEWRDQHWRSLSAIAREITGARWSGPRFFGVATRASAAAQRPGLGVSPGAGEGERSNGRE
jgi:hypothetical protein